MNLLSFLKAAEKERLGERDRPRLAHEGPAWGVHDAPDYEAMPATLDEARARHPHVDAYVSRLEERSPETVRYEHRLPHGAADEPFFDLLYPVGDPVFIHIQKDPQFGWRYNTVEPILDETGHKALEATKRLVFRRALYHAPPRNPKELANTLEHLFDRYVLVADTLRLPQLRDPEAAEPHGADAVKELIEEMKPHILMPHATREAVRYRLLRDLVGGGPLEPVMRDPYIEDIHSIGVDHGFVIHKQFAMIPTNIAFDDEAHADTFIENLSERIGRPVSESRPIVDATLEDGSRINIVYSDNISRRGPSFSIRRVAQEPVAVTRLIKWGTLSPHVAAYLWLCLENGMSLFLCGDAACGKTTTLNAILSFVDPRKKIYTAEDTPEVVPPHPVWQRLITRETGPEEGRVRMFDLLKAALRSRPNYIVVGEIRGAEGAVAFQAMQTGHPCLATFHAASVGQMVQRLTAAPIHVPLTFIDNLNVALIQKTVRRGDRLFRRVTDIAEIEGYSAEGGGVLTRPVFTFDPKTDRHQFRGRNNSHILEKKIAEALGYADTRLIYDDLDERAMVLSAMVREEVFDYDEVNRLIDVYLREGITGLPFTL